MKHTMFLLGLLAPFQIQATDVAEPEFVDSVDQYWEMKRSVPPRYPSRAIKAGITGYVRVNHTIDAKGRVRDIEIIESVPPALFDKATIRALKQFRYRPTEQNAARQPVRVEFKMNFDIAANKKQP